MEIPEIKVSKINEIDVPVVQQIPSPVTVTPINKALAKPVILIPSAELPSYEPIDVPTTEQWKLMMEAQNQQQERKEEETNTPRQLPDIKPIVDAIKPVEQPPVVLPPPPTTNLGVPVIEVPLIGEVPIPPKEQVLLAGTTATASVAAAIIGKSLVEWMVGKMKPIVQQMYVQAKKRLRRDLTPYELQVDFAAQLDLKKKIVRAFQKELKLQKKEQFLQWEQQQRLHKSLHTETEDENGFLPSWLRRISRGERVRNRGVPYQSLPSDD